MHRIFVLANRLKHTRLTIKSEVYKAFVNPEESFREGLVLRVYIISYITQVSGMRPIEIWGFYTKPAIVLAFPSISSRACSRQVLSGLSLSSV